ncbi:MAG: NAD(P)-dependent alcohol dehydrogenase [Nitrospinae bacterium]|jgi:alcohol/geraniol dehydrogenase (NADP+)|nr:NAD(P)-dependent alcohol dehydrogenase [Nitrospinota bacterium]MDA1109467.1 NAD(P)-dependent alcohol dehydrogenase [Nitrospinota bacterium]
MSIRCYAAKNPKERLETFQYEPKPLERHEVAVKISHCGICHSDIHLLDNDWGITNYPFVPGHEIVGTIQALGADVQGLSQGERVGIGWQRSACLRCEYCVRGLENLCPQIKDTCVFNHGGFAEFIHIDGRFAFPLPEALDSETTAPLLCGGVTVYSALNHYGVRPSMKVGVIGIGGLGHLALQFANAMGCEVTAFSSTPQKQAEARGLGAHHFVFDGDSQTLEKVASTQDFILSTVSADLNWESYVDALRPGGKLCFVGVPKEPIKISAFSLIVGQNSICGNPIGSRTDIREMLDFAALHNIKACTEAMPMSEVNAGLDRVRDNQVRYRVVLTN